MLGDAELLSTSVDWVEARPRHGKGEGTIIRVRKGSNRGLGHFSSFAKQNLVVLNALKSDVILTLVLKLF